jgi:AraC-like DNA-binding protein
MKRHPGLQLPKWNVRTDSGELLDGENQLAWEVAAPAFKADIMQIGIIDRKNHVREKESTARNHLITMMIQGHFSVRIDGITTQLHPGDLVIVPAGTTYCKSGVRGKTFSQIYIKIAPTQRWAGLYEHAARIRPYESAEYLYLLVWRIAGAYARQDVLSIDQAMRDSYTLVDLLMQETRPSKLQESTLSLKLRDLVDQIRSNPAYGWTNAEMANRIYVSERTLFRLFKREFGISPKEMVIRQRMMFARRLLEFTDQKVDAIAQEVGYANRSVFSELFFKHIGVRPTGIRKGDSS